MTVPPLPRIVARGRASLAALVVCLSALASLVAGAPQAHAQDTLLTDSDDAAGLLAELNVVAVTGAEADAAARAVRANLAGTAEQADRQRAAEGRLADLASGLADLQGQRDALQAKRAAALGSQAEAHERGAAHRAAADAAQRLLNEIAASAYIGGDDPGSATSGAAGSGTGTGTGTASATSGTGGTGGTGGTHGTAGPGGTSGTSTTGGAADAPGASDRASDRSGTGTGTGGDGAGTGGTTGGDAFSPAAFTTAGRRARYASDLFSHTLAVRNAERAEVDRAGRDEAAAAADAAAQAAALEDNAARVASNGADQLESSQAQGSAVAAQQRLATDLVALKADLAKARRLGRVVGADFPLVLLDAFRRAELYETEARPRCGLNWQLLAAISKIESNHGTFGGSKVAANGDTSMIIGPRLDGGNGFANIPDSDGGRLDGDPLYDRAVGPMQFIPSSWRIFGQDGNHDNVADPRNVYDATLAAAEHLCRGGADLSTPAGFRSAVLGYNNSDAYVAAVASTMSRYLSVSW